MKFPKVIFLILSTIFFLLMTVIFTADSLFFLVAQLYEFIFENSGFWSAFLVITLFIILLFFLFLKLIELNFLTFFISKEDKSRMTPNFSRKVVLGVLTYELSRIIGKLLLHKSAKKRQERS